MAYSKVEICGVDTTRLPVLTAEEMRQLIPRVHAGDKQARDEFIQGNLRLVLAVLRFVKIATCYMDYRKHGQFDFTAPAILFACLLFSLTAPSYIWDIL